MAAKAEQLVLKCPGWWLLWETDGRWSSYPCHSCGNTGDEYDKEANTWTGKECECCDGNGEH